MILACSPHSSSLDNRIPPLASMKKLHVRMAARLCLRNSKYTSEALDMFCSIWLAQACKKKILTYVAWSVDAMCALAGFRDLSEA